MDKAIIQGHINTREECYAMFPEGCKPYRETIKPGVFNKSIKHYGNVPLYFNHDKGRMLSDSTEVYEDETGITFTSSIDDIEVISKCLYGKIKGCSFGYVPFEERVIHKDYINTHIVVDMAMYEISLLDRESSYRSSLIVKHISDSLRIKAFHYYLDQCKEDKNG